MECLEWLSSNGHISYDMDIRLTRNHSKTFQIVINNENNIFDVETEDNGNTLPFVQLTEVEFEKIVQSAFSRKHWLMSVFLHMKKRICINGMGDEAPYCFASLDTIHSDVSRNVNISRSSVANVIDELVRIGLFYEHKTGSYVDCHGKVKAAVNFYALSSEEMDHEVCDKLARRHIEDAEGIVIEKFIR